MTTEELYKLVYSKYGMITRARGCFLYTKKGVRLTDLFLENGRAVLGWDGKNAATFFKNMLSKGLTGGFICEDHSRLDKAVSTLLGSERITAVFTGREEALKAGLSISAQGTSFYRPWNPGNTDWTGTDCVIMLPPFPWCDNLYILAVRKPLFQDNTMSSTIPGQSSIPFAQVAAITRAIYNLIEQLKIRQEKDWFIYDPLVTKYWTRKGPYLFPKMAENQYEAFVKHCLECGLVINPSYNAPSIIPYGADLGVFSKLKTTPFTQE